MYRGKEATKRESHKKDQASNIFPLTTVEQTPPNSPLPFFLLLCFLSMRAVAVEARNQSIQVGVQDDTTKEGDGG